MKKLVFIIPLLISSISFSQSNVSDLLNQFKLGSTYVKTSDLKERFAENDLISCQYIGNDFFKIDGVDIANINLMFYKNQLMVIEINLGNPFTKDDFDENEWTRVTTAITKETGVKAIEKTSSSIEIIKEVQWKKENVNYNLKRLKFKHEGSDKILGLLLITDIKISDQFMANMKR